MTDHGISVKEKFIVAFDDALDVPQEVFERMFAQFVEIAPAYKVVSDPWGDLMKREIDKPMHPVTWMARKLVEDGAFDDLFQNTERDWERLFNAPTSPPIPYDAELAAAVQRMNEGSTSE